jgi:hypothetical protein
MKMTSRTAPKDLDGLGLGAHITNKDIEHTKKGHTKPNCALAAQTLKSTFGPTKTCIPNVVGKNKFRRRK